MYLFKDKKLINSDIPHGTINIYTVNKNTDLVKDITRSLFKSVKAYIAKVVLDDYSKRNDYFDQYAFNVINIDNKVFKRIGAPLETQILKECIPVMTNDSINLFVNFLEDFDLNKSNHYLFNLVKESLIPTLKESRKNTIVESLNYYLVPDKIAIKGTDYSAEIIIGNNSINNVKEAITDSLKAILCNKVEELSDNIINEPLNPKDINKVPLNEKSPFEVIKSNLDYLADYFQSKNESNEYFTEGNYGGLLKIIIISEKEEDVINKVKDILNSFYIDYTVFKSSPNGLNNYLYIPSNGIYKLFLKSMEIDDKRQILYSVKLSKYLYKK